MSTTERAALKRALSRARPATTLLADVCDIILGIGQTAAIVMVLYWLSSPHLS